MRILERLMKIESLRTRVFVPLMFALLLLLCSMALILQQSQEKVLEQELAARTGEAERLFLEHLKEETHQLSLALQALTLNPELLAAFKAGDRRHLQALTQPYFERLRDHHHIPLLNFTGPDRTNILRLHQPDRYGDRIDRFTTLQAETTGKEASGIELDPLGITTLRVVSAWHDEKNLLGYIEAGMEIEHILLELEEVLGNRVYTFVDKAFVEREDWEEGLRLRGHSKEWGRFPGTVSRWAGAVTS